MELSDLFYITATVAGIIFSVAAVLITIQIISLATFIKKLLNDIKKSTQTGKYFIWKSLYKLLGGDTN